MIGCILAQNAKRGDTRELWRWLLVHSLYDEILGLAMYCYTGIALSSWNQNCIRNI